MTTLYRPVLIESVEQAEALPVGTVALGPARWDPLLPVVRSDRYPGYSWHSDYTGSVTADEVLGWTALVPIEAEEVWGSQDKSGGISRAHAGAEDPHATVKLHIAERTALGHPDRLVSRYVTPWEEA